MFNLSTQEVVLSIENSPLINLEGLVYQKYDNFFRTGILEGAQGDILPNPEAAPPIEVNTGRGRTIVNEPPADTANIPLPEVGRSNLPLGGAQQSNLELYNALFHKGGIVDAKKINQR